MSEPTDEGAVPPAPEGEVPPTARRASLPLVWGACALAALLLTLGVNGTLASWTTAIVVNDDNRAGTAQAVILSETGPDSVGDPVTCASSDEADNGYTCTVINKYGDGGVEELDLTPGGSVTTSVTLTNTGGADASSFTLAAGSCTSAFQAPLTGTPSAPNTLCQVLQVAVSCTGDATLTVSAVALSSFTGGTLLTGLGAGETATCAFTVSLSGSASPLVAGQTATQDLTWTLTA